MRMSWTQRLFITGLTLGIFSLTPCSESSAAGAGVAAKTDQSTPTSTLKALAQAQHKGDVKALRALVYAATPEEAQVSEAAFTFMEAQAQLREAAVQRFNVEAHMLVNTAAPETSVLDQATSKIEGEKATVTLPGQGVKPVVLIRKNGKWAVSVASLMGQIPKNELEHRLAMLAASTRITQEVRRDLSSTQTIDDAVKAMKSRTEVAFRALKKPDNLTLGK